jgi:membrane-bound metal-dependent hydrolase YbcI (DUF457 family)
MQGPTHLMVSWYFAEAAEVAAPRDRRIVAWAGFMPDIDVLAYVAALAWYRFDKELAFENVWKEVHHKYTHNIAFVVLTGIVAWWLASDASRRAKVAVLAMTTCALHNFLDVVGAGPTWPIYPLWPLSGAGWHATWSWTIGDWQNIAIFVALTLGMFAYAKARGRSPVECFGDRADAWFTRIVREGSDARRGEAAPSDPRLRWMFRAVLALVVMAVLAPLGFNPFG